MWISRARPSRSSRFNILASECGKREGAALAAQLQHLYLEERGAAAAAAAADAISRRARAAWGQGGELLPILWQLILQLEFRAGETVGKGGPGG